jgi:DNA polymerase zeta
MFIIKPTNKCLFDQTEFETYLIIYDREKRSMATSRYLGIDTSSSIYAKGRLKSIDYVYKEEDLFEMFLKAIRFHDPDILIGFEIQKLSWCFLVLRANFLNLNEFCNQISRLPKQKRESVLRINLNRKKPSNSTNSNNNKPTVYNDTIALPQDLVIAGRVVLNLWRVFKSEVSLNIYTFENCCYHILKERNPKYSFGTLTSWFIHRSDLYRWRTIDYYLYRSETNLRLISRLDLIGKYLIKIVLL